MAELADALDSKSSVHCGRAGSIPAIAIQKNIQRIIKTLLLARSVFVFYRLFTIYSDFDFFGSLSTGVDEG